MDEQIETESFFADKSQHDGHIEKHESPDVERAMSWRQRRLSFDEAPLEEMVRELNRYGGPVRLRREGIAPESRRYGGVFDADDPESRADILRREPDLLVEPSGTEIVIRAQSPSSATR